MVALARQLMVSRYGELLVACRDAEERVRFLGYDPANVKTVAYMIAAFMAGIAGALFVPIVGIVSPNDVGIVPVDRLPHRGGDRRADHAARAGARCDRGGLGGHDAVGDDPSGWTYIQGFLFMLVIAFLPGGPGVAGRGLERAARPVA
jgi:urea transport system permease protein